MRIGRTHRPGVPARPIVAALVAVAVSTFAAEGARAQGRPDRQRDRGTGIPTSMFGTYVEPGQLIVYPFVEYYLDADAEYSPEELGYGLDQDFRGQHRALEGLLFLGYGISERWAVELEAAYITARQDKADDDPTAMPRRIEETGLGDVEGQIRYRWSRESESRPEIFSYFETVFPLQKDRTLIGTQAWEFKLGTGLVRGFSFGTLTVRVAAEYDGAESKLEAGEYAVEYLRRLGTNARLFLGVEGSEDEVEAIPEIQLSLGPGVVLKLNSAFGLTSKATDWAPEAGVMVSFRP